MEKFLEELRQLAKTDTDVSMKTMTTLRIGGIARYVVYPENTLALDSILRLCEQNDKPVKVIGKGSNLLCSDEYYDGVILRLDRFDDFYFVDDRIVAQAGCSIIALSYQAMSNGLSGLEFASGIPATVGGVTYMNAGAYLSSMSEVIESVFVYRDHRFEWISNEECEFAYRTSVFQKHSDWIIVAVKLKMTHSVSAEIRTLMDSRRERRMNSQPLDKPSAGSVFRNPKEEPAWKLIEGIGYRGHQIGGAKVSEKHVNFIVNEDQATAEDFLTLVKEIQEKVQKKYNISLYMEVEKFNWR